MFDSDLPQLVDFQENITKMILGIVGLHLPVNTSSIHWGLSV